MALRKRAFADVLKMFDVDETVEKLFFSQKAFFTELPADDVNNLDYENFEKDDIIVR